MKRRAFVFSALVFGAFTLAASTPPPTGCPNNRLTKNNAPEHFIEVGIPALEQSLFQYTPIEVGEYFCLEDITTCTYYLDWDGFIRQCEEGKYFP